MLEHWQPVEDAPADGSVVFWTAGESAAGVFRCAECGYGICINGMLPSCPMCTRGVWEADAAAARSAAVAATA